MTSIFLQGAYESLYRDGLLAVAEAMLYIADLARQYERWEDDGGTVGSIPYLPPFPGRREGV